MDVNEIKRDIKNQISEIDQTPPGKRGKSLNHELLSANIDSLEFTLKGVSRKYKNFKVFALITLTLLFVSFFIPEIFSDIKRLNGTDLAFNYNCGFFLNVDTYKGLILPSLFCLILTFRLEKVKVKLEKKIILIRLLDNIDRK